MDGRHDEMMIRAPPGRVFDVLGDLDQADCWRPDLVAVQRLQGGPVEVGSRWRETRRVRLWGVVPANVAVTIEVREAEPGRLLGLVADDGLRRVHHRFTLARHGKATQVIWEAGAVSDDDGAAAPGDAGPPGPGAYDMGDLARLRDLVETG